ncbi:MAG: cytochrome-c oxidase [Verrucomicrobia bacterium]|nr:cytochrome-c oxidase [Pseudomonadota bacterium]NBS06325.1 cytochrome-c oxidase [Verrucomicrobiota bacterium]NBS78300.1 cytochrome-c oxidase [bacterium]NBS50018.1 cytochrome-c oxidase [Verrucomicrobiota bacterium]NBT23226.1 cytochrome-c oxidase [bacterium]
MKSSHALILVFLLLLLTWAGQVALGFFQVGRMEPILDEETNYPKPPAASGLAQTGARVFASEGCLECHSLSARGPTGSADLTRGWGPRRSVPRDYLFREPALIGLSRVGSDLSNIGLRVPETKDLMLHLYNPRQRNAKSNCPPHPWLFDTRLAGTGIENEALPLPSRDWQQLLPTYKAKALVAYLQSLRTDYSLPEAPLK